MSDGPTGDPIFLEQPQPVGAPPAQPEHEHNKHHATDDWVVVDRVSGDGARSKLQSQHRHLEQAGIDARIEHDGSGRTVLEVHKDDEREAVKVIGKGNAHGVGEKAHRTSEARIEEEEREALKGPFKMANSRGFVTFVVVAFVVFMIVVGVAWALSGMWMPK